jgi:hypothetical protein
MSAGNYGKCAENDNSLNKLSVERLRAHNLLRQEVE